MGNSEVGHLNLGAGRVVMQDLVRINQSIADGDFFENPALVKACEAAKRKQSTLHLVGLVGSGGVHALDKHLFALIELASRRKVGNVAIHALLDGRAHAGYDDIADALLPALRHRLILNFQAEAENVESDALIGEVVRGLRRP